MTGKTWVDVPLAAVGQIVTGTTPSSGDVDAWGSDVPFLTPTDIVGSTRFVRTGRHLSQRGVSRLRTRLLPNGSVCFTCIGATIGKMCMTSGLTVTNQQINSIVVDKERFDPVFVYFNLRHHSGRIAGMASGSATPIINKEAFGRQRLSFPGLGTQRAIAEVLGALDDKIECKQSIFAMTEGLAITLFADAAKRLEDSEGDQRPLSDLVDHLPGKYLPREQYSKGGPYAVYGSNSVMGSYSEYLYEGPITVMARIGSNCGALMWSEGSAWVNNNASALRAKPGVDPWVLHRLLQTIDMDPHRAGSGQPFVRVDSLLSAIVTVPPLRHRSLVGGKLRARVHSGGPLTCGVSA
jgi:type I restriction enzyme S subunit